MFLSRALAILVALQFVCSVTFASEVLNIAADSFIPQDSRNVKVNPSYANLVTSAGGVGGSQVSILTYEFHATSGEYKLEVLYAAAEKRPVKIEINGLLVSDKALSATTGDWVTVKVGLVGTLKLREGRNRLVIRRDYVIPHIQMMRLTSF